ncbi:Fic family protein [Patescibacteria group bacterium]|nr:Fic family protein [Patescibacteria group bacterium]
MNKYIWQLPNWSQFSWDKKILNPLIANTKIKQEKLLQKIQNLMDDDLKKAQAIIFEKETLKTAQIEGEKYNPESVKSSINKRLGLESVGLPKTERHIDGLVEVLFDATQKHDKDLTKERLFKWHAALFPTGYSGLSKIDVGKFRSDKEGSMKVVSGVMGLEKIHYQAPPATNISKEIEFFLNWWKASELKLDNTIRAGISHLYFVTIHPFDNGNGRIARVITDMALSQNDKLFKRYYSLSNEILNQRKSYYEILEQSQKGNKDITNWLVWFANCFSKSLDHSDVLLKDIFAKTKFWKKHSNKDINEKQKKVINKLLDAGKGNFDGNLTSRKYMSITSASKRTAVREIQDLLLKKMLIQNEEKGRNINYDINW